MELLLSLLLALSTWADACEGGPVSEARRKVRGLYTDPSSNLTGADGALRVAKNIVIARAGMATPRPGFQFSNGFSNAATKNAYRLAAYYDETIYGSLDHIIRRNDDDTTAWSHFATAATITTDGSTALAWNTPHMGVATARKNLYLATDDGVRVLNGATDTQAGLAGSIYTPLITYVATSGASGFLAAGSYAGYALVITSTDAQGLVKRSHALGHAVLGNGGGASANMALTVEFGEDLVLPAAGAILEVYRTRSATSSTVGREFFLTHTRVLTSGDLSGYTFTDSTVDANLGAALYVNDSREGVQGANMAPPQCEALALFRGSLFFGDCRGPQRLTIRWKDSQDCTGSATGIGHRTLAGTRQNGSSVILMASTTGLEVGMMLENAASWSSGAPVIIASLVTNTSVTVDTATWSGATDGAPVSLEWLDTIRITETGGGVTRYQYYPACETTLGVVATNMSPHQAFMYTINRAATQLRTDNHDACFAYAIDKYDSRTAGSITGGGFTASVVVEEKSRGLATTILARATKNTEYLTPMSSMGGSGTSFVADDIRNCLSWSKTDEPEHVPLSYFERVGSDYAAILRLIPTRDALWIFKEDGLWRLSGVAAPNWRIDPIDTNLRLLARDAVAAYDDAIYALTNRGVVEISDARGVVVISEPIEDKLASIISDVMETPQAVSYGLWIAAQPRTGIVIVAVGDAVDDDDATHCYAWNVTAREWTEWDLPFSTNGERGVSCALYHGCAANGRLYLATNQGGVDGIAIERAEPDGTVGEVPIVNADFAKTATLDCTAGSDGYTSDCIITSGTWGPSAGDAFTYSGNVYQVLAITGAMAFTCIPSLVVTGQAVTAYEGIESVVEWQAFGDQHSLSRFYEFLAAFENARGLPIVNLAFLGQRGASGSGVIQRYAHAYAAQPSATTPYGDTLRFTIPRDVARSTVLFPKVTMRSGMIPWSISGAAMRSEVIGSRVNR